VIPQDATAEGILERLGDLENCPEEALAPYEEFRAGTNTCYFTPGGFLYRKDPGTEEVGEASSVGTCPTRPGTTEPGAESKGFQANPKGAGSWSYEPGLRPFRFALAAYWRRAGAPVFTTIGQAISSESRMFPWCVPRRV
jgi:hypothetical protein